MVRAESTETALKLNVCFVYPYLSHENMYTQLFMHTIYCVSVLNPWIFAFFIYNSLIMLC